MILTATTATKCNKSDFETVMIMAVAVVAVSVEETQRGIGKLVVP